MSFDAYVGLVGIAAFSGLAIGLFLKVPKSRSYPLFFMFLTALFMSGALYLKGMGQALLAWRVAFVGLIGFLVGFLLEILEIRALVAASKRK